MGADAKGKSANGDPGRFPPDTRRSLPIALLRAREAVMARFRPMLAGHDVTEQQWRVLRVLAESGELDASDLAGRASILAPSLTRILRSLEERKLIHRRRDDGDGRRSWLSLAPDGSRLIEKVTPQAGVIYAEIEARFGKERIEALLDMLDELVVLNRRD